MKIGMCMYLWTTSVGPDDEALLADIKAAGFDGIEVPIFDGTPADYELTGRMLDRLGLDRTATSAMGNPLQNPISAEAEKRAAGIDYVKWAVECAAAVGARTIAGPLHSTLGHFSGSSPDADEFQRSVNAQLQIGEHAKKFGVTVALEAVNRFECYLVNTMDDLAAHIRAIGHPNIRAMYDTFHANIEEQDPAAALTRNIDVVNHIHISENDRGVPGRGHVAWEQFYAALAETDYDRWLTIESFGRGLPDLAAATRCWRDFAESSEVVYREGYQHIRKSMQKAGLTLG